MLRIRLSVKLPFFIVLTVILTTGIAILLAIFVGHRILKEEELEESTGNVQTYASAISYYLSNSRSILETIADLPEMKALASGFSSSQKHKRSASHGSMTESKIAESILKHSGIFEYILFLRPDGSVQYLEPHALRPKLSRHDLAFMAWYKELIKTRQTVISDLHISTATQRPTVIIATPIRTANNQIIGIWAGGIKLEELSQIGHGGMERRTHQRYGYVTDGRGLIIAHQTNLKYVREQTDFSSLPPVQDAISGQRGTMQFVNPIEGEEQLSAYMPLPGTKWAVVYVVPVQVAFAPIKNLTYMLMLIGVGVSLLFLGLAYVGVVRPIVLPLKQLTAGVERIGGGDLTRRIEISTGDELEQLANEFNQMVSTLSEKEAQLRAGQKRLQFLLSATPAIIYTREASGDYGATFISDNITVQLGYEPREFLKDSGFWANHIHPDETQRIFSELPHLFEHGHHAHEYRFLHKDGAYKWIYDEMTLIRDAAGNPLEIAGYLIDVTMRKQAEEALRESQQLFEKTFESLNEAILILDSPTRTIISCNPAAAKIFGYKREEMVGRNTDFLHVNRNMYEEIGRKFFPILDKDGVFNFEYQLKRKDGTIFFTEQTLTEIKDDSGKRIRIVSVIRDITERKAVEEALRKLNEELEQRVAERTAELSERVGEVEQLNRAMSNLLEDLQASNRRTQEAVRQLESKNKELETFTYSVSHDLKAPLRGIEGYSRLLLQDYTDRLDGEGRYFLKTIRSSVNQMNQMIDDLLTYSRIERRSLVIGQVNLQTLVEMLLAERDKELKERNIRVSLEIPCENVTAEAEGLTQVLRNLIDNAIKFIRDIPEPRIEIKGEETEKSCILWVRDNGLGFDMKYHDRIFEIFQRLHRAEDYPGTGIGLAIVRKAMERMGGRAWAESKPGEGATFYLEVPK